MLHRIWNDIVSFFNNNLWGIVKFFAVLIVGGIIIKIIINVSKRMLKRTSMEGITRGFIVAIIKFILYLILALSLLSTIGVEISGIVTALSAAVLAIGVALQNIIANVANGIVIVSSQMFKTGDFISIGSVSGSVANINFLFTTLSTSDNRRVTLPNSMLINNEVINYGTNATRRVDFTFSVAYESDVELVKKIVLDVMASNGNVRLDEGKMPFCRLKNLGASSLDFFANCWVDSEDYWDVYYYVMEHVYNEFKRNNISVPFNQLEIRDRKDEVTLPVLGTKLPERVEKERHVNEELDLENADLSDVFEAGKQKIKEARAKIREMRKERRFERQQEKIEKKQEKTPKK